MPTGATEEPWETDMQEVPNKEVRKFLTAWKQSLLGVSPNKPTYLVYVNCSCNTFDSLGNAFLKKVSLAIFQLEFLKS